MCTARVLQLLRALFFFIEARCSLPYSQWRHDTPLYGFRCTHAAHNPIHPLPHFSPSLELTQGGIRIWEMDFDGFKKNTLAGGPHLTAQRPFLTRVSVNIYRTWRCRYHSRLVVTKSLLSMLLEIMLAPVLTILDPKSLTIGKSINWLTYFTQHIG